MLICKKAGQAQLLAAIENRLPRLRLRKSGVIVSFLPIMAMREIGSEVGDEQERGKEQNRDFSDSLWHFPYNKFNGAFC